MTLRQTLNAAGRMAMLALRRGTVVKADDTKRMQELKLRGMKDEEFDEIEHFHPYGISFNPLPPSKQQGTSPAGGLSGGAAGAAASAAQSALGGGSGGDQEEHAEIIMAHLGGAASHLVALLVADRRHRFRGLDKKGMKDGEFAIHDFEREKDNVLSQQFVYFQKELGALLNSPLPIVIQSAKEITILAPEKITLRVGESEICIEPEHINIISTHIHEVVKARHWIGQTERYGMETEPAKVVTEAGPAEKARAKPE